MSAQPNSEEALEAFRRDTRAWLEANCPQEMREPVVDEYDICWGGRHFKFKSDAQRVWLQKMAERGWTVPEWPKQYGGGGLSKDEARVLREEMAAMKCRSPLTSFGISMLGPALLKFGNEQQKGEHLPRIARGEIRWCQGYSEPGAGSDLASLKTRADDHGDHFVVNGSKIWTSYGDKADWIFCLVRTSTTGKKQEGISFLLFDMETPGISTRPIRLISGYSPFTQTFFDNVKVPKQNLLGELNKGWTIAKYLLTHERNMIGGMGTQRVTPVSQLAIKHIGLASGRLAEPALRTDIARFEMDAMAFALTMNRVTDEAKAGNETGAMSSMLKYYGTELNKRRAELTMSVSGSEGLKFGDANSEEQLAAMWLRTKANSIEGGTSEIQLNIIAKNVLRLPGA
ncbi:acyl-CoA dehydrogenase family protein [Steroidobacter sp. S1-65]|uniref:Acyl-CoA dehydrogenase family protein n=1 Tax=Steroidobacter gossypii TaxID=2805490 RepID=A0ABS1X1H3_9GAMM|nr:acyl-CoA dehydrogenase family protein [Steroidobacter gossypii]MBM0107093.1 acyl-CoA dehydrogenase family protein [Steroidobacter gossypii]